MDGMFRRLKGPKRLIHRFLQPVMNKFSTRQDGSGWPNNHRASLVAPRSLEGLLRPGRHKTLLALPNRFAFSNKIPSVVTSRTKWFGCSWKGWHHHMALVLLAYYRMVEGSVRVRGHHPSRKSSKRWCMRWRPRCVKPTPAPWAIEPKRWTPRPTDRWSMQPAGAMVEPLNTILPWSLTTQRREASCRTPDTAAPARAVASIPASSTMTDFSAPRSARHQYPFATISVRPTDRGTSPP